MRHANQGFDSRRYWINDMANSLMLLWCFCSLTFIRNHLLFWSNIKLKRSLVICSFKLPDHIWRDQATPSSTNQTWCFLCEFQAIDTRAPSPGLYRATRGCGSAVLFSWLCLCVSLLLRCSPVSLMVPRMHCGCGGRGVNVTRDAGGEGYNHHWNLPQFTSWASAENVHISKHFSHSYISR